MAATRPADERSAPADVAEAGAAARFGGVAASADGDALAAAGLLARALRGVGVPFQVHVDPDPSPATDGDALALTVGTAGPGADRSVPGDARPASLGAADVSRALGVDPDAVLALAGAVAAGAVPGAEGTAALLEAARERDRLERRPGVAVPTADVGDGLAHSTLLHAPFSGDLEATREALAGLDLPADPDGDDRRRVASLAAIETVGAGDATPRAAAALERALRPYATPAAPFATLGGYADVLGAVARERPGTGVALALGHNGSVEPALDAWREHALAVHAGLRAGATGRYDGLLVARIDGADPRRLATAARLLRAFRSPEPVALAVADGAGAVAGGEGTPDLGSAVAGAAERLRADGDGTATGYGGPDRAEVRFESEVPAFVAALREEL